MNNTYKFYYKNDFLFNIISILFTILFLLLTILMVRIFESSILKVLSILFILLFLAMWMYFVKKKLELTYGEMKFNKKEFEYTSCGKTYYVEYDEVLDIRKVKYEEDQILYSNPSYYYEIKIKDSGYFIFRFVDASLDDVIRELAKRCDKKIKDV